MAFSLVLLIESETSILLSTNKYNADNALKETTFGNGGKVMNTYDTFKLLKGVRYDTDAKDRYVYDYAANGQIAKVTDKNLNRVTVSEFDVANRPFQITTLENGAHLYNARLTYDEFSQPKSFQERISGSFNLTILAPGGRICLQHLGYFSITSICNGIFFLFAITTMGGAHE